jgi:hypothetical protein
MSLYSYYYTNLKKILKKMKVIFTVFVYLFCHILGVYSCLFSRYNCGHGQGILAVTFMSIKKKMDVVHALLSL